VETRAVRSARLWYRLALALALAIGLLAVLSFLPTPYILRAPGKAQDVAPMIKIPGRPAAPRDGKLLLTTVIYDKATALYCLYALMDPKAELLPHNPGPEGRELLDSQADQMDRSQYLSKVAALLYLGYDLRPQARGARVLGILPGSPAENVLRPGDVITEANGKTVRRAEELTEIVRATVGGPVRLLYRRGDKVQPAEFTPYETRLDGQVRRVLGLQVQTDLELQELPVEIDIEAGNVSGASAGLVFSLGIVDRLGTVDLTRGRLIAGTGTLDALGRVGAVFGSGLKVVAAERAGAQVFLCPLENLAEARSFATRINVVPVGSLREAVEWLSSR